MLNLAVIFGGDSCEADVSIITAMQSIAVLDKNKYTVFAIYYKDGKFLHSKKYNRIESFNGGVTVKPKEISFTGKKLYFNNGKRQKYFSTVDCALLCTHGGGGENGSLQGFLEMMGIPYTSCDVLSSAIGMDKLMTKSVFANLKLAQLNFVAISKAQYTQEGDRLLKAIAKKLQFPIIVKPNNQGSSIGIKIAQNIDELANAVSIAGEFCEKIICERALEYCKELNCAVMRDNGKIIVSEIEKPIKLEKLLSFDDKYLGGKMSNGERELPALISPELTKIVQDSAKEIYTHLGCDGVVRVDFLLSDDDKVFVNEINTLPGSLAFYLFKNLGYSQSQVIDCLIDNAFSKYNYQKVFRDKFESNILCNNNFTTK